MATLNLPDSISGIWKLGAAGAVVAAGCAGAVVGVAAGWQADRIRASTISITGTDDSLFFNMPFLLFRMSNQLSTVCVSNHLNADRLTSSMEIERSLSVLRHDPRASLA